jgi:hypothetical protein
MVDSCNSADESRSARRALLEQLKKQHKSEEEFNTARLEPTWTEFFIIHQGSFLWLQNTEGKPVVGVFATNHQPQVLPPYFAARKKNPVIHYTEYSIYCGSYYFLDII